ncbi:MAG: decaprenyl-phosphate phosphoribosyltransferase [Armatimonadota bacterium]
MFIALLESMRPRQWTKNFFVFPAIVFAQKLDDEGAVVWTLAAFIIFCFLSSSVYIVNDIADAEKDRQHPTKRNRPIASGRLPVSVALPFSMLLAGFSVALAFAINRNFVLCAAIYLGLNLLYSFSLKHIVILDVVMVAIFFVLRAVAGAAAINVMISHWLLICTFLLALFIAMSKRRHELVLLEDNAASHRASLTEYSPYLLDQMIAVVTASTVMGYILYTVDQDTVLKFGTDHLVYTVPFVVYGIFRYLYLIHQKGEGGDPDRIVISDRPFLINFLLWAAVVVFALYLPKW